MYTYLVCTTVLQELFFYEVSKQDVGMLRFGSKNFMERI